MKSTNYPGNAPPMRALPIGLLNSNLIDPIAIMNADATHPHPKARAASILIARAAEFLMVKSGAQEHVISYCQQFIAGIDLETIAYLEKINTLGAALSDQELDSLCGPQPLAHLLKFGLTVYGLPADAMRTAGLALYIVKHARSPFEALQRSMHIGGDVDSLGAITVGLLGGLMGLESLPQFMLSGLEELDYLDSVSAEFQRFLDTRH